MPDHRKVAVFWDYENCSPPLSSQGYAIVSGIRRIAHVFGRVMTFKTYLDMSTQSQSARSITFRSELQSSGVSMVDCPHNGRKDVVDKMILVDMLAFALDHHDTPATIILIAGDRDYAYAMSTLRLRQYTVVLIMPSGPNTPQSLQSQASVVVDWNYAILGKRSEADTPPVRQPGPYHDVDGDLIERLISEIRDSTEDPAVTLLSSSHPTATAPAHTRHASAAEPLQPSVFQQNTASSDAARPPPTCTPKKAASGFPEIPGHFRVGSAASRARSTTQSTQSVPDIDRDSGFPLKENNNLSDGGVADECVSAANEIQDATDDPFARPHIMSPRVDRYQFIAEPGSPPIANFRNFSPSPSPSATSNLGSRVTPQYSHSPPHSRTISGGTAISFGNQPKSTVPFAMPSSPVSSGGRSDASSALKSTNADSASGIMDDSILPSDRAAVLDALGLSDDEDEEDYSSDGIANGSNSSPRLTEVDDTSHVYALNVVESTLYEGEASFHDIARSPPANDTSPSITESSGSPLSQQSSLSASFSNPDITMPNVGIGSPQATSVISNNSDNHSSGYYTPPFETVEDRIRRLTPPQFLPLINQLLLARSKGIMKPTRSAIAIALVRYGTDVYQRAGVTSFWEYTRQAEQASLVVLGGQESQGEQSWIALHPDLFKEETTTEPVEEIAVEFVEEAVIESIEDKIRRFTPPQFLSLINQLLLARSKGIVKPTRSAIAIALVRYGADVYQRAGVTNFLEYTRQAEQASLVVLGGQESQGEQSWIALHPDLFKEETTTEPVEEIAIEFVEETVIESIEDKIQRLTPPQFLPLIDQLLLMRSKGVMKPGRSTIAVALVGQDKEVYKRAGATKWKDYASHAEKASLVELGGWEGDAWISLHPRWFKEETNAPTSPTPSSVRSSGSPVPQVNIKTSAPKPSTPPPSAAPRTAAPNLNTPPMPAVSCKPIAICFIPLITCLLNVQKGGMAQPLRSTVGLILGPAVYYRAGVATLKEYLALAVDDEIVEIGGANGFAWVRLHPDILSGKRA